MKVLKIIGLFLLIYSFNSTTFSEEQKDCSKIDTSTGVGMYDKYRCQKGLPERKKNVLKNKIKKLNIFKKTK